MSRIKGKDTKPEMLVRRFLHANGFRYKLHDKSLPGKPDIVLPKYKTAIFVHACLPAGRAVSGMDIRWQIFCCSLINKYYCLFYLICLVYRSQVLK
jgi:DNA mismatch endonuclease Vsr